MPVELPDQFQGATSYIMTDYIKYIEAQGARVVPLINSDPWYVTKEKVGKLDGILIPGGGGDYLEMAKNILNYVIESNS